MINIMIAILAYILLIAVFAYVQMICDCYDENGRGNK